MPRKLDFGADEELSEPLSSLPLRPTKRAPIDPSLAQVAAERGRAAGFVPRDGAASVPHAENSAEPVSTSGRRRPGRPRREPQTRVSLAGPVRVIERFQDYCLKNGDVTYWQGLEQLLDAHDQDDGLTS